MEPLISVQSIRAIEGSIIDSNTNVNQIINLKKILRDSNNPSNLRMAALNSLRRIFVAFLESGKFGMINTAIKGSDKLQEYRHWLIQQFNGYKSALSGLISVESEQFQAPAIRTFIEFVKREYYMSDSIPHFGRSTLNECMHALLYAKNEVSADILLMIRGEAFSFPDFLFHAMIALNDILCKLKDALKKGECNVEESEVVIRNALDILRVMQLPEESTPIDKKTFLVQALDDNGKGEGDSSDDDDSEDDEATRDKVAKELKAKAKKARAAAFAAGVGGSNNKRKLTGAEEGNSSNKRKKTKAEQMLSLAVYKKHFSKAWLSLLSMPLTTQQHKVILSHLRDHVIEYLPRPLLLADYLSNCYENKQSNEQQRKGTMGGAVSVLALESLLHLIITYNLDYPEFYPSLYRLCNIEVFTAKYRTKFMKLLTLALKSTNLPGYLVAAFIKRLAQLAIHAQSPAALFCISQITWLLRKHPQCMVLLHRVPTVTTGTVTATTEQYDPNEETDLVKCNALSSSLWELELLQSHQLHSVAVLAKALMSHVSTSSGSDAPHLQVEDFIEQSYSAIIEEELKNKRLKQQAALAYTQPNKLIAIGFNIDLSFF